LLVAFNYWGLTASILEMRWFNWYILYQATISIVPTAAISSVYTYRIFGAMHVIFMKIINPKFGVMPDFMMHSKQLNWSAKQYLAIDQGPQVVMLRNLPNRFIMEFIYRCTEVRQGMINLGFHSNTRLIRKVVSVNGLYLYNQRFGSWLFI
jgi:hypothetical protein